MKIPNYRKDDIEYAAIKEGDHSFRDFNAFLHELISSDALDGAALGIAKRAVDVGTESLSPAQLNALKNGIEPYKLEYCERCHEVLAVRNDKQEPFLCSIHSDNSIMSEE